MFTNDWFISLFNSYGFLLGIISIIGSFVCFYLVGRNLR